jgi:hypothetical protein
VYNKPDGTVKLEWWVDENATNTWVKKHEFIDHGQWTPRGQIGNCGAGQQAVVIAWGGPLTVFRSDNLQSYDIKWVSIRSIDPTRSPSGSAAEAEKAADRFSMDSVPEDEIITMP